MFSKRSDTANEVVLAAIRSLKDEVQELKELSRSILKLLAAGDLSDESRRERALLVLEKRRSDEGGGYAIEHTSGGGYANERVTETHEAFRADEVAKRDEMLAKM